MDVLPSRVFMNGNSQAVRIAAEFRLDTQHRVTPVDYGDVCVNYWLDALPGAAPTSLDDLAYLLPDGRAGEFASRLRVYGKEAEPCPKCGTPIRRVVIRQGSTHWCPHCQR